MTRIVHIGPGAFHRAHQAIYTEDAADGWQITGVSLRSADFADALIKQNGRYTLVTRGTDGIEYRQVTAMSKALAIANGRGPVLDALTQADTRIISLTITEKGYAPPFDASSAITLLVQALQMRKDAGRPGVTLLSCDNLTDNGAVLQKAVTGAAPSDLADWIAAHVRFPSTMVDRITPATTAELRAEVAEQAGWADEIPVETEAFSQWVIEDNFAAGRPDWEHAGAELVPDVAPYEQMKLRMLNGAHSMLAYCGHLTGKVYVRDVMADPALAALVARHMDAAAATLDPGTGLNPSAYRDQLLTRFRNPHIAHKTYQIAMDGSQKMPQRMFAPAQDAVRRGQDVTPFSFATACWLHYLGGRTDAGDAYALRDPREAELAALPSHPKDRVDALFALPDLLPAALAADPDFRAKTAAYLLAITQHGLMATTKEDAHV
ncbi:Mannitol 2-dehydrogenase (plasmid) [Sulfitobacter sp. DSM 110093]|uniref:mannitol dehydrogenase family protein n=1 Tax=Sulfitobacter sp. DSM 110093 TaxID=2883127 RepID=UPI001FAD8809|nr:mannitol dehydrogenase family protein [Sulfitobacter sp. DSM 110093]UOA33876.1 Mannitol 2-dehydrogenase [Sulfitobacter sp. DSM 110093]